jgi:hypothetical protein
LNIRGERREDRARAVLECIEAIGALVGGQRITMLIEHGDFSAAYQKIPSAAYAVIKSGFPRKERAVTQRPDHKFVPKAPVAPRGVDAISQKVHEKV